MKPFDLALLLRSPPPTRLWAMVLLLAIKDRAARVYYRPARENFTLCYEVDGATHEMAPPPVEMAPDIVAAIRNLLYPQGFWHRLLRRRPDETHAGGFTACISGANAGKITGTCSPADVVLEVHSDPEASTLAESVLQTIRS